jgi:hypothetical protein
VTILSAAAACISDQWYTVRVSGDDGLPFIGIVKYRKADGTEIMEDFDSTVPAERMVKCVAVGAALQKNTSKIGEFIVEIVKGDKVMGRARTIASYGTVNVTVK